MNVNVLYFARLREVFGVSTETLVLQEDASVDTLLDLLRQRGDVWADNLAPQRAFRVAVNQDVAQADTPLNDGAEVAIFPPVTGG
jgi:molybdopterin synthase sulfur carrier subunit